MRCKDVDDGAPIFCEFCGDYVIYVQRCDNCGMVVHEQCIDMGLCPYCHELELDEVDEDE